MARFKPVPEPPASLDALAEARRAVPLVPDAEADCCARLQRRLDLNDRQQAETWLMFLRALGLVERKRDGFARTRGDLDRDALAAAFRDRVVGAAAVLDAVESAEEPITVSEAFAAVRETVPEWERRRHDDWAAVWRDRTARTLAWAALFGSVERRERLSEVAFGGD
jgi:hypothetical protein